MNDEIARRQRDRLSRILAGFAKPVLCQVYRRKLGERWRRLPVCRLQLQRSIQRCFRQHKVADIARLARLLGISRSQPVIVRPELRITRQLCLGEPNPLVGRVDMARRRLCRAPRCQRPGKNQGRPYQSALQVGLAHVHQVLTGFLLLGWVAGRARLAR